MANRFHSLQSGADMATYRFGFLWHAALAIVAIGLSLETSLARASDAFHVGDSVTATRDTEIKVQDNVVGTLAAGTTVTIKKIEGALIFVDSDVSGWVRIDRVIAFDKAAAYFTAL